MIYTKYTVTCDCRGCDIECAFSNEDVSFFLAYLGWAELRFKERTLHICPKHVKKLDLDL